MKSPQPKRISPRWHLEDKGLTGRRGSTLRLGLSSRSHSKESEAPRLLLCLIAWMSDINVLKWKSTQPFVNPQTKEKTSHPFVIITFFFARFFSFSFFYRERVWESGDRTVAINKSLEHSSYQCGKFILRELLCCLRVNTQEKKACWGNESLLGTCSRKHEALDGLMIEVIWWIGCIN